MTTIAQIVERIRREDPVAAQIAEECKKAIVEKSQPWGKNHEFGAYVYPSSYPPQQKHDPKNRMALDIKMEKSTDRAVAIVEMDMPDIEVVEYGATSVFSGDDVILHMFIRFRQREGSKP